MRFVVLSLVLLASAMGCSDFTGPALPMVELQSFTPPPSYELWWQQVEECSGRRGDLSRVQWLKPKDGAPLVLSDGVDYAGYWWRKGNRIALVNPERGSLVRHEMLHALLQDGEHPLEHFAGRCAGVVDFEAPVAYGATPHDLLAATTIRADSALTVAVTSNPSVPSLSRYGGRMALVVTATNRLSRPVWINAGSVLAGVYPDGGEIGTGVLTTTRRFLFGAHQSRRVYIDWRLERSGELRVEASFLSVGSNLTSIYVTP